MKNPPKLDLLKQVASEHGFPMSCDDETGALLRALAASCPLGIILELGTGVGVSTAWLLDGLASGTRLVTVDKDAELSSLAKSHLGDDLRIAFHIQDASGFLTDMIEVGVQKFDLIFADAPAGKYSDLDKTIGLLNDGGVVVFDDMRPDPHWRQSRVDRVEALRANLQHYPELRISELDVGSGIILAVKGDTPPTRKGRSARHRKPLRAMNDT